MNGNMVGFIVWIIVGFIMVLIGVFSFFSKKPAGFWANAKPVEVKDVKAYNHAVGSLFMIYGLVFNILGIPLLKGNGAFILLTVAGVLFETILLMVIYTLVIEKKFRKK